MCSKQHKAEIDAEYNLGIISRLYEGDSAAFWALLEEYKAVCKQSEVDWLLERWPEGEYQDVVGLCKVAKLEGEDIIGAINQQDDYAKTRNYWKCLKNKFNPSLIFNYPFFLLSSTLQFSFAMLCTTNFSRF